MRVWVDCTNSPHVLIFRPLIRRMEERGHEVVVTSRDFAQTIGLLDRYGIPHTPMGAHGGGGLRGKARAMTSRSSQLARMVRGQHFDLAADEICVHGARRPLAHLASHTDHELIAQLFCGLEGRGVVGIAHDLQQALAVAQVDENHAAVVPAMVHPAANGDFLVDQGLGDVTAIMSSHGAWLWLLEGGGEDGRES